MRPLTARRAATRRREFIGDFVVGFICLLALAFSAWVAFGSPRPQ